jgi:peptidoglycan biosynthesis protein MviN/MurJ (putative lipid II flippase)
VVHVLAGVFALQTLASLSEPLYLAHGETRLLFLRYQQMLAIRDPLIVAGMLLGGLKGVILARVISGSVSIYLAMRLVHRSTDLGLWKQLAANTRAFASTVAMTASVLMISPFLTHESDSTSLLIKIAVTALLAAAVYLGTSTLLWMFMRRPAGPEREVQLLLAKLFSRLRAARSVAYKG